MTWEQKFQAARALAPFDTSIMMRDRGDWYISHRGIERKEGGCLSGGLTSGKTPEEAVNQYWEWLTDPKFYIVLRAGSPDRQAVSWNGFMWSAVQETEAA